MVSNAASPARPTARDTTQGERLLRDRGRDLRAPVSRPGRSRDCSLFASTAARHGVRMDASAARRTEKPRFNDVGYISWWVADRSGAESPSPASSSPEGEKGESADQRSLSRRKCIRRSGQAAWFAGITDAYCGPATSRQILPLPDDRRGVQMKEACGSYGSTGLVSAVSDSDASRKLRPDGVASSRGCPGRAAPSWRARERAGSYPC